MQPIASAITTFHGEPNSKTGTPGGGRGLLTPESLRVAEWLARQEPTDMDKAAVSRASSRGVDLEIRYEWRYPEGKNGERMPSYRVAVGCDISYATQAELDTAKADLLNFMTPAPIRTIEEWLAVLSVKVVKRQDDEFAEGLRISVYSAHLSQYPADVVRHVLTKHSFKYWPAWDELEKLCIAMTSPRSNMIAALSMPAAEPPARHRPPTDEEKQRVQALVDELFPGISSEWRQSAVAEVMKGNCIKDAAQ